jgi:hypothetical protein
VLTTTAVALLATISGNADTTLILGRAQRDLTGDGIAESLQVIGVGPTVDSLELTFTIESSGELIYRRRLAPMTRAIGFDAGLRTMSEAEHRARLQEFGAWFFGDSKFQAPAAFVEFLRNSAPRGVAAIPNVISRDRPPNDTASGAEIWREILASQATVFSFSPGGDEIVAIAWNSRARRFYRLIECC